ncbi:hypothetical protein [Streptomyces sp. NPDC004266]|uniref:hypothetical protein n=1 Tax=Streptomyces sp. NPDC004266 TaxID=3364693 RepID=UPI0036AF7489
MTTSRASRPAERLDRLLAALTTVRAPHQAAVFRIGLSAVVLAFLLREWPHRHVLYGDRSPLSFELAQVLVREERTFTVLAWGDGALWFEAVYVVTMAAALAVMLGWRTRGTTVVLMAGVLSIVNRNTLVGDGGDNVVRIMVIYLVFTRCAQVCSLDARRARLRADRGTRDTPWPDHDPVGPLLWAASVAALVPLSSYDTRGWSLSSGPCGPSRASGTRPTCGSRGTRPGPCSTRPVPCSTTPRWP